MPGGASEGVSCSRCPLRLGGGGAVGARRGAPQGGSGGRKAVERPCVGRGCRAPGEGRNEPTHRMRAPSPGSGNMRVATLALPFSAARTSARLASGLTSLAWESAAVRRSALPCRVSPLDAGRKSAQFLRAVLAAARGHFGAAPACVSVPLGLTIRLVRPGRASPSPWRATRMFVVLSSPLAILLRRLPSRLRVGAAFNLSGANLCFVVVFSPKEKSCDAIVLLCALLLAARVGRVRDRVAAAGVDRQGLGRDALLQILASALWHHVLHIVYNQMRGTRVGWSASDIAKADPVGSVSVAQSGCVVRRHIALLGRILSGLSSRRRVCLERLVEVAELVRSQFTCGASRRPARHALGQDS